MSDLLQRRQRRRLAVALAVLSLLLLVAGLAAGSEGWSLQALRGLSAAQADLVLTQIRAPRTLGAWGVGALLGKRVGRVGKSVGVDGATVLGA